MNNRDNYNKIYDNAVNHLNASKVLAQNLHYGYAISHIVLGIEELIKYQVMETHSSATDVFKENEVDQKSKSIFRNHQTKHELLAEFIKACSKEFAEIFQESIFYSATGQSLKADHIQIQQNRFKEIGNIINGAFSEANFTEEERRTCLLWLKNANTNKNDGFYVDFNGNA